MRINRPLVKYIRLDTVLETKFVVIPVNGVPAAEPMV